VVQHPDTFKQKPSVVDAAGNLELGKEATEELITWVFEDGGFVPLCQIGWRYAIQYCE
jgi:hypothetical protein